MRALARAIDNLDLPVLQPQPLVRQRRLADIGFRERNRGRLQVTNFTGTWELSRYSRPPRFGLLVRFIRERLPTLHPQLSGLAFK